MSLVYVYRKDRSMIDLIDQLDLYEEVEAIIEESLESISDSELCSTLFEHYSDDGEFDRHELCLISINETKVSVHTFEECMGHFEKLGKFTTLLEALLGRDENIGSFNLNEDFLCNNFVVPKQLVSYFKIDSELRFEAEAVSTICEYYHQFYKGEFRWQ